MAADEQSVAVTLAAIAAAWAALVRSPDAVATAAPALGAILSAGQLRVARKAAGAVPAGAVVELNPAGFARRTPAGASPRAALETAQKVVSDRREWLGIEQSRVRVTADVDLFGLAKSTAVDLDDMALGAGQDWAELVARTAMEDTARDVAAVDTVATPGARWIRVASSPCCKRCAVLSGKTFTWSAGFERHPKCQCRHEKYVGSVPNVPGPLDLFESGSIRDLNRGERMALTEGGDFGRVVNASRLRRALASDSPEVKSWWKKKITAEYRRQQAGAEPRFALTPQEIVRHAGGREEAVAALARNGYTSRASSSAAARLAA